MNSRSLQKVEIPYGGYWSTPFAKWQTEFAHLHSLKFAGFVAQRALLQKEIPLTVFDHAVLGCTIPQHKGFWGMPWVTGIMELDELGGPTISEACATGLRSLWLSSNEIALGNASCSLLLATDRLSNSPHIYYPATGQLGGVGTHEDWTIDNMFEGDPNTSQNMVEAAENVADRWKISMEEQHDMVLERFAQYEAALADNQKFQSRYMTLPFEVPDARFRKTVSVIAGDIGVYPSSRESVAKLQPVPPARTVTFAAQTHPADATSGVVVASSERARELTSDAGVKISVLGFGYARVERGFMPFAPVPAVQNALRNADLTIDDVDLVKTHNPFVLNDIVFCKETGFPSDRVNQYGCSLIYGHPHAATTIRQTIELIEALAIRGGGIGVSAGCAAGDVGMAVAIRVDSR